MAISFIKLNVPYRLLDSTADTYVMVDKVTSDRIDVNTFVPKLSEVFFFPEENGYRAIKIGDGVNTLEDLPFAGSADAADLAERIAEIERMIEDGEIGAPVELPTISGTVTNGVGGISKGKVYTNADITQVLTDLLFPYIAPTLNSLALYNSSSSQLLGTYEYGTTITVAKVKPSFTKGSKNITSIKVGTSSGGNDLYSGTTATSGATITLTNSKTFNGATGGTIYCTISDGQQSSSKNTSVSYAFYTYYAVTDSTVVPTSWTPVGSTSVTDITINANAGQYVWIASTGNYAGICELNELSGKYNVAADTTKVANQTLVNSNNYTCTHYNFYRLSNARAGSGNATFKLQ